MRAVFRLALFSLSFCLVTSKEPQQQLVELAAANGGVINLDESTYNLLSSPKRTWSASVQFTAMDKRRKCAPCKSVDVLSTILPFNDASIEEHLNLPGKQWPNLGPLSLNQRVTVTFSQLLTLTMHRRSSKRYTLARGSLGNLLTTQALQLGLATAPVVYILPATEGPRRPQSGKVNPLKYDFSQYDVFNAIESSKR